MMNLHNKQEAMPSKWSNSKNNTLYFVTIYTNNKLEYLGQIIDGKIQLSAAGKIAQNMWQELPKHFDGITSNAFTIMPDHIHAIVSIRNYQHNISNVINAYMRGVQQACKEIKTPMQWQENHYAHLVPNEKIYENILAFINEKAHRCKRKIA